MVAAVQVVLRPHQTTFPLMTPHMPNGLLKQWEVACAQWASHSELVPVLDPVARLNHLPSSSNERLALLLMGQLVWLLGRHACEAPNCSTELRTAPSLTKEIVQSVTFSRLLLLKIARTSNVPTNRFPWRCVVRGRVVVVMTM
jgi:hypothetical protein